MRAAHCTLPYERVERRDDRGSRATIMEDHVGHSLDEDWSIVAAALAGDGDEIDRPAVVDAFLRVLEDRIRGQIVIGPPSDPSRCRIRPRFRLLREVSNAFDFIGEMLLERRTQFVAGTFRGSEMGGLERQEGLARIASATWLERRMFTYLRREASHGMVGMPEKERRVGSLDAGENGSLGDGLGAASSDRDGTGRDFGLLEALAGGRPVLVLDLSAVTSSAIVGTAGLQLWRRLDADASTSAEARAVAVSSLSGDEPDLEAAHDAAMARHDARIAELRERRLLHPGMEIRTAENIERQINETLAATLLWPLLGATVTELFGLPSVNAGEQRISKYRKALPSLLPALVALANEAFGDEPDGAEDES